MVDADKIRGAIAAHARWKHFLKNAVATQKGERPVTEVQAENECEFGQWLLSLPVPDRQSVHWQKVRALHAEFHRAAAHVLELALAGKREEAEADMKIRGDFTRVSSQLTIAMAGWKRDIAG